MVDDFGELNQHTAVPGEQQQQDGGWDPYQAQQKQQQQGFDTPLTAAAAAPPGAFLVPPQVHAQHAYGGRGPVAPAAVGPNLQAAPPGPPTFTAALAARQPENPVVPDCLMLFSVLDQQGVLLRLHLLRVRWVLGKGGNGLAWQVGWSRRYAHWLVDPQQPWEGISSSSHSAAVAAVLHEQQQQQRVLEQQQQDNELDWQDDDRALKTAIRYAEQSDAYKANCSYERYNVFQSGIMHYENGIAMSVSSDNVIKAYGAGVVCCSNGEQLPCMLLERAEWGSLSGLVYGAPLPGGGRLWGLNGKDAWNIMLGIARGISDLHCQSWTFHRDLKCGNILLGGTLDNLVAKIADFGTCR